jgi:secretion/DNA translocation related TadE-like protein
MSLSRVATAGGDGCLGTRGSVSLAMAVALAFAAILSAFAADLARASGARAQAQVAADAAALAAAQELVIPSETGPEEAAAQYAERNGGRLVDCLCSPQGREVVVTVEVEISLPLLRQTRTVQASARAVVVSPEGTAGLQPSFVASLNCLFDRVSGLWVVSGFRTHAQQAALYRMKPGLAAPPGHSMHEVGLAADLGFPSGAARSEAHREAAGCGLAFPVSYEPWHVEPA